MTKKPARKPRKQTNLIDLLTQAATALDAADLETATRLYLDVEKQQPGNVGANLGLGMILNRCGKGEAALGLLGPVWQRIQSAAEAQRASLPVRTQAEILAQIGLALQIQERVDEALVIYKEALKLSPAEALQLRVRGLEARALNAHTVSSHLDKANQYLEQRRYPLAQQSFENALKLNPDNDRALHGMATLYYLAKDLPRATALVQHAIIMQPAVAEYQNTLGAIFMAKSEFEKARIFLRRAIDLDHGYARAYSNLGVALKHLGRYDEAVQAYRKSLELQPDAALTWNNLGNLQRMLGQAADAEQALRRALELDPGYAEAADNLKLVLQERARPKPAAQTKPAANAKAKPKSKSRVR